LAVDEFSGESKYDSYLSHSGTVFVALSGDSGTPSWTKSSKRVIGVGGISLASNGNCLNETAWSLSGGVSSYEAEPDYQAKYGITASRRGIPDVSFDANPDTGVAVYDTTATQGSTGWFEVGGTSLGAPCWSALMALADQVRSQHP
jgi:subtilase family serine protease